MKKNFMKKSQFAFGSLRGGVAVFALVSIFACGGASANPTGSSGTSQAASVAKVGFLNLAVKFVQFTQDSKPVLSEEQVRTVIVDMNKVYAACNINFLLDEYLPVDPAKYGLDYTGGSMSIMDKIRAPFDTPKALVVTDTGAWDHGAMGPANAWTAMPGQSPSGAVLESAVADNGNIVAHELGHYLNLDHVNDQANLMNPIIYGYSTALSNTQCEEMRLTATTVRAQALRQI